jgi:hypothetical protein
MSPRGDVLAITELLRSDSDAMWTRLRHLLAQYGVDVQTAFLAQTFPDDPCFEFGIVVTGDRRVYQFGFDYLHSAVEQGRFTECHEMTDADVFASVCHEEVAVALELVKETSR